MNKDAKVFKKNTRNMNPATYKKIIYHNQVEFIPEYKAGSPSKY